jgi:hypothetical protein
MLEKRLLGKMARMQESLNTELQKSHAHLNELDGVWKSLEELDADEILKIM